jgi:purine-nucleoside phosphorylase
MRRADLRVYQTLIGRAKVDVVVTGMGTENAGRIAQIALADPYVVCINAGFAGALKPGFVPGDILVARSVIRADESRVLPCSRDLVKTAWFHGAREIQKLLSADRVINSTEEKKELGRFADAVDMEGFAVLNAARLHSRPAVAIRAVSDPLELDMPIDFNRTANRRGGISVLRVLGEVARSPRKMPALVRFGRRSRKAAAELALFLDGYVKKLSLMQHGAVPLELQEVAAR